MDNFIQKSTFRDWTLDKIDEAFNTKQIWEMNELSELLNSEYTPNEMETWFLKELQSVYSLGGDNWNEVELENKFISPLIVLAKLNDERFSYFLERDLEVLLFDKRSKKTKGFLRLIIAKQKESEEVFYFLTNVLVNAS